MSEREVFSRAKLTQNISSTNISLVAAKEINQS